MENSAVVVIKLRVILICSYLIKSNVRKCCKLSDIFCWLYFIYSRSIIC